MKISACWVGQELIDLNFAGIGDQRRRRHYVCAQESLYVRECRTKEQADRLRALQGHYLGGPRQMMQR